MREIKFRCWDGKRMIEPSVNMLIQSTNGFPFWQFGFEEPKPMTECILMQYTGLKDKNGKEIYEGDIVSCYSDDIRKVVQYIDDGFCIDYPLNDDFSQTYISQTGGEIEVIGNIYENPDLLKD